MASTTIPSPEPAAPESPAERDALAADDEGQQDWQEVLVVEIGAVAYALPGPMVREVARAAPVTALPGAPDWVRGVCAVRGALLPVADLGARATPGGRVAPREASARDGWMVVVEDAGRGAVLVGLRVRGVARARVEAADAAPLATSSGLPGQGAVRLVDDGRRGAGAAMLRTTRRTRVGGAALPPPASPGPTETGSLVLLDVSALLHDLYDEGG